MSGVRAASRLQLLPVAADDPALLAGLSALATAAYLPHYADLWADGGSGYAHRAFAPAVLTALAGEPRVRLRLLRLDGEAVGFAQWRLPGAPSVAAAGPYPDAAYLERLYFLPAATGQGLGTAVLGAVDADARRAGLGGLWLRAMVCRPALVAAYRRQGFVPVGGDRLDVPGVVPGLDGMVRLLKRFAAVAGD